MINSESVTVTDEATALAAGDYAGASVVVRVPSEDDGGATIDIGGEDVAPGDFPLGPGEHISIDMDPNDGLFAIAEADTAVFVLRSRVAT